MLNPRLCGAADSRRVDAKNDCVGIALNAVSAETVERPDASKEQGVGVTRLHCKPDAVQLGLMRERVQGGRLAPHVATVLPLSKTKQALALSEAGHTRGKIVLQIGARSRPTQGVCR
jgi:NADPH:quinone reductase-like Zn-dependent oxidoreductase